MKRMKRVARAEAEKCELRNNCSSAERTDAAEGALPPGAGGMTLILTLRKVLRNRSRGSSDLRMVAPSRSSNSGVRRRNLNV
jgi:hypothetical protein